MSPSAEPIPQFRNLVFEGGGVKGMAYIGAMEVFRQRGYLDHVQRVGGTSAGAINALIHALGYSIQEQREILASTDFRDLMDSSFGVIRDIRRLAKHFGWHKGDFFKDWLGDLIEQKLGSRTATFADLKAHKGSPDVYVIGTNLSTGFAEVFSHERHSDMPLVDAVRISMSIPLFYQAVRYPRSAGGRDGRTGDDRSRDDRSSDDRSSHHSGAAGPGLDEVSGVAGGQARDQTMPRKMPREDVHREDVYVDGGVQLNYPIKLFDRLKYISSEEACAGRWTDYYNRENARFLLDRPGRSPYVYNCQTLGLRLDTKEAIGLFRYGEPVKGKSIKRFGDYARALMTAVMNAQEKQHLKSDDWQRTVYINTLDVGATDFDLSDEKKEALVEQGIVGAERYLNWFEHGQESPVNRLPM